MCYFQDVHASSADLRFLQYPELADIRKQYPKTPISALTATANAEVERDILCRLDMPNCAQFRLSFNRKNLYYEVRPKKQKKCIEEIAQDIKQHFPGQTGIIYCLSRTSCEDVAKVLREDHGIQAKHYHAKMDNRDRERVQREWSEGKVLVIVATVRPCSILRLNVLDHHHWYSRSHLAWALTRPMVRIYPMFA